MGVVFGEPEWNPWSCEKNHMFPPSSHCTGLLPPHGPQSPCKPTPHPNEPKRTAHGCKHLEHKWPNKKRENPTLENGHKRMTLLVALSQPGDESNQEPCLPSAFPRKHTLLCCSILKSNANRNKEEQTPGEQQATKKTCWLQLDTKHISPSHVFLVAPKPRQQSFKARTMRLSRQTSMTIALSAKMQYGPLAMST